MTGSEKDPTRVQIIRELLAEAEAETPRTTEEAVARNGAMSYLRAKLDRSERVMLNGD